jgi:hypothetical protein
MAAKEEWLAVHCQESHSDPCISTKQFMPLSTMSLTFRKS